MRTSTACGDLVTCPLRKWREMYGTGIRVAVIEDNTLLAESLVIALNLEGYEASAVDLCEHNPGLLLASVLRRSPHVALIDLDLGPDTDGARLVEPLTRSGVSVVVVTGSAQPHRWGEALAHGARHVMPKSAPLNDIAATIRKVHLGQPLMSATERADLIRSWRAERLIASEAVEKLARLTPRECEVLAHFVQGHQVKQIAEAREVSEATVRTQTKAILAKLEVSSQLAAVSVAHLAGWTPPV